MPRLANLFHRPLVALLAAFAVALATVGVQGDVASGRPPVPARVVVDSITSPVTPPAGTPTTAVPYALVAAGQDFTVTVSFYDASGAPASFNHDTTLAISTNTGASNQPSQATGTAFAGEETATLTTSLPYPVNQVAVTVSVPTPKGSSEVAAGSSQPTQLFDVLDEIAFRDIGSGPIGIGGDQDCASVTEADPVCGVVLLPNGARSSQVMLSLGSCGDAYSGCSDARGSVVQALADLGETGELYTRDDPAALLVKCDKTLCLPGAIHDIELSFSLDGNVALEAAPECPAKNTIGPLQTACVDYVQSTRDGAGDSLLYLLFTRDVRTSIR